MESPKVVAVLGTGIMGFPIARNLAKAGFTVRAWNRTISKAEPLKADGVIVAETPAKAAETADVVMTVLYDAHSVLSAMCDSAASLQKGVLWLQCATCGIEKFDEIVEFAAKHKLEFVDSPLLGTRQPAENGQLCLLPSGPEAVRDRANKIFDVIGKRTIWVSSDASSGASSRVKLVLNNWISLATHATAETSALAKASGVDMSKFFEAIAGGPIDMGYLRTKYAKIASDAFEPDFSVEAAVKDSRLILQLAEEAGVALDCQAAGRERFKRAITKGHGEEDMAASYFASF